MPRSLLLKEEKELLGFYVTGHPLDGYREALKGFTPLYQMGEENGPVQDGEFVRVAGLVADCNIRLTKKGDNMAILTLEDFTGRLSVLVFPKAYNLYSRLLMQDAVLAVEGRFSVDEREAKVLASEIVELREGEPAPPLRRAAWGGFGRGRAGAAGAAGQEESGVTFADRPADGPSGYEVREDMAFLPVPEGAVLELTVPADKEACVTTELIPLLQAHPGTHMVFLKLLGSRRRLRLHPNFYTDGSDAFQDAVRKLLGDGAFRVKPV